MLSNNRKIELTGHVVITLALVALIIVASFFDEKISASLYGVNFFSKIGAVLGKIPAYFIFAFAGAVLCKSASLKEKKYRSRGLLMALYTAVTAAGSLMLGYSMVDDVVSGTGVKIITALVLAALSFCTVAVLARMLTADKINMLKKWAFTSLIAIAAIIAVVAVIKLAWGRMRYEDIVSSQGAFTPWYAPQGYTGNKSMPSGHVALGACMFLLVPMFKALPNMKPVAIGTAFIAAAFTLLTALSRIMGGHHFLSDVTIAIAIAYIAISVSNRIAYGKDGGEFLLKPNNILNKF